MRQILDVTTSDDDFLLEAIVGQIQRRNKDGAGTLLIIEDHHKKIAEAVEGECGATLIDLTTSHGSELGWGLNPLEGKSAPEVGRLMRSLLDPFNDDGLTIELASILLEGLAEIATSQKPNDQTDLSFKDFRFEYDDGDWDRIVAILGSGADQKYQGIKNYLESIPGYNRDKGAHQDDRVTRQHEYVSFVILKQLGIPTFEFAHRFVWPERTKSLEDVFLKSENVCVLVRLECTKDHTELVAKAPLLDFDHLANKHKNCKTPLCILSNPHRYIKDNMVLNESSNADYAVYAETPETWFRGSVSYPSINEVLKATRTERIRY